MLRIQNCTLAYHRISGLSRYFRYRRVQAAAAPRRSSGHAFTNKISPGARRPLMIDSPKIQSA